jgi:tRNA pseudouridine38-40 synthase
MSRFFLEVAYKGTNYSGFQIQQNANSIQSEIEKALQVFFKQPIQLTGSSRTDAGVHALQNYFHFDAEIAFENRQLYSLNAILPDDIVLKSVEKAESTAHCRFDAVSRQYKYYIYSQKDPFLKDRAWFYTYRLDIDAMNQAAKLLIGTYDFTSFSKKNTQVKNFICTIEQSEWSLQENCLVYTVKGNRFLRGMVRGLVGTMVRAGRNIITVEQFHEILLSKNPANADFTTPAQGLFLIAVSYPNK